MRLFIILTFAALACAFYFLSGGTDFVPETQPVRISQEPPDATPPAAPTEELESATENPPEPLSPNAPISAEIDPPQPANSTSVASETLEKAAEEPNTGASTLETEFESLADALNETDTAAEQIEPAAEQRPVAIQTTENIKRVGDSRLNMRSGPGTENAILVTLEPDTELLILQDSGDGWVQVEVRETGLRGWTAEEFLIAP